MGTTHDGDDGGRTEQYDQNYRTSGKAVEQTAARLIRDVAEHIEHSYGGIQGSFYQRRAVDMKLHNVYAAMPADERDGTGRTVAHEAVHDAIRPGRSFADGAERLRRTAAFLEGRSIATDGGEEQTGEHECGFECAKNTEGHPLTYTRNDGGERGEHERLRPGISKLEKEIADCPTCSGQLVHLPGTDVANPYDERALIMCAECFRAVLVEVTETEEPGADTPEPGDYEQSDIFDKTGMEEPRGQRPDPSYSRERGGYTPYGWTGPTGVSQKDLFDFEDTDDEHEAPIRTDGGEQVRRTVHDKTNEPGGDNLETTLTKTDTGVRIRSEVQRGTGTNDRDKVIGEVKRETLGEAAEELRALEDVMSAHLRLIRGWDEDGDEAGETNE